jgi:hypothetical protein
MKNKYNFHGFQADTVDFNATSIIHQEPKIIIRFLILNYCDENGNEMQIPNNRRGS